MVRETRHLWVGNLPDNVREERIREHFQRYNYFFSLVNHLVVNLRLNGTRHSSSLMVMSRLISMSTAIFGPLCVSVCVY